MRRRVSSIAALAAACCLAVTAVAQASPPAPPDSRPPADLRGDAAPEMRPGTPGAPPHRPPSDPSGGSRRGGPPPVEVLGEQAERLGLDAKTREGVHAVIKDSRAEADRLREGVTDARERMRDLLSSPDADEVTVMRQADTIGALELEEHKNWLRAMMRIRALLTPEQRVKLIRMRKEMFAQVFAGSRAACSGDIERLCPGRRGDEATRACMRRYRNEVSDTCRDAIAAEFAKRRKPL